MYVNRVMFGHVHGAWPPPSPHPQSGGGIEVCFVLHTHTSVLNIPMAHAVTMRCHFRPMAITHSQFF